MGDIMGYYGQDDTWFWRPDGELIDKKNGYRESTGPNGEFAFTEHVKLFYRNGSWPEVIEGYKEYNKDFYWDIPEGFSCEVVVPPNERCIVDHFETCGLLRSCSESSTK